ncbi:MAG: GTPase Era [Ardenticatenia bacterium]|nr:MAG: GTPase Era [Ardenticatenia bacterium]
MDESEGNVLPDETTPEQVLPITPPDFRSGFVAVVGRPNVGKSTLMNVWLGQKVAIVSPKPQTTRHRLLGIYTDDRAQVIFMDTPGIHQPRHLLGKAMVETATRTLKDADVVLCVVDASESPTSEDTLVTETIRQHARGQPVILALNKIDLLPTGESPYASAYVELVRPTVWLPISATRGDCRDELLQHIIAHLPTGPAYYPSDQVTDQTERFMVAELIREAALHHLHQEVPHALAVVTDEFSERDEHTTYISATLYVERDSQKRIVIGQDGRMLKAIGQSARREIEQLLGKHVYLDLWVKVWPKWRKNEADLHRLGYLLRGGG